MVAPPAARDEDVPLGVARVGRGDPHGGDMPGRQGRARRFVLHRVCRRGGSVRRPFRKPSSPGRVRYPAQDPARAEDHVRDHVRDPSQDQLRLAFRTLAACGYRWSSGNGRSGCTRASRSARRMPSRRWRMRAGSRLPGRCTMPWNGCSTLRAGKALLRSLADWRRAAGPRLRATRSPRSPRRWTFGSRKQRRSLGTGCLRTASRRLRPVLVRTAIGSPIRRWSSRLRTEPRSPGRRTAGGRRITEAIAEARGGRTRWLHHQLRLARIRLLRLRRDPRDRAEPGSRRCASGARRRCAGFCRSGLITLLERAFQQVMHARIHAAIGPCCRDPCSGPRTILTPAPIAELRPMLIRYLRAGLRAPVLQWNDQVGTVR